MQAPELEEFLQKQPSFARRLFATIAACKERIGAQQKQIISFEKDLAEKKGIIKDQEEQIADIKRILQEQYKLDYDALTAANSL